MNHLLNLLNIKSSQKKDDLIILLLILLFTIWLGCWISFQKVEDTSSNSPSNKVEGYNDINFDKETMSINLVNTHYNSL